MVVAIRLARAGQKHRAFYRIVVAAKEAPRDGKFLEKVGTYDPLPTFSRNEKLVTMNIDRIKYWLSVGAQPSEPVAKLLGKAGLLPPFPRRNSQPPKADEK